MSLTDEQMILRRSGIGSSDISAVVDQDPHRGPIDVWLDKVGMSPPRIETTAQWTGHKLEPVIASMYEERTGTSLFDPKKTSVHGTYPWALATVDRRSNGNVPIVEIKNVGGQWSYLWTDELPPEKLIQVQWQLEVCNEPRADIAALLGGTDFVIYRVERDYAFGAQLLELAEWFWNEHVVARVPPPHDGAAANRLAGLRWRHNKGSLKEVTVEATKIRDKILRIDRSLKKIQDLRDRYEAKAKEIIADSDGVDGCFSWKRDKTGKISWAKVAKEKDVIIPEEIIKKHTGEPVRRFLIKEKKNER